jgi:acyl carrier protein
MVLPRVAPPSKDKILDGKLKAEIEAWLANWFAQHSKLGKSAGTSLIDIDYFAAGWLTSMEVVEFITEIEQQFTIQFSDDDMHDPRFVTIAGLTQLILQHSTQSRESR